MTAKPRDKLELATDGVATCMQYDVFFDGKRQTQCTVADAKAGYVIRYKLTFGVPAVDRHGKRITELVNGKVEIVPKGSQP